MKKITLLSALLAGCISLTTLASPSPVVQVISYKEPLGMYFSLQGWGSGSIIDGAGHILTNNHVVDDGLGGISDDFAICITENPALPPNCHYTASVIARNPEKDIALLQIDAKDIFGNAVQFSGLSTLEPDFSYTPNTGDTVLARGYPWVGANTITETQGIVSGTYAYNNNTYIKTDTLIAGGNSGGPLIRNDKMVGVNTFLIGGFFDPALGYSLSILEAKDFISQNLGKSEKIQNNNPDFSKFLATTTDFSTKKKLVDPLITFNFSQKYNINTYIRGSFIGGQIGEENSSAISAFSFLHYNTPVLKTPEDIRYFLSSQQFFPFWNDIKFTNTTIGGQQFYQVDQLGNTAGDKAKTQYVYFKVVDQTHLLLLQLQTPYATETNYNEIQINLKQFLSGITFPEKFTFGPREPITVKSAHVGIQLAPQSLVDFQANFFPYSGIISQLMSTYQDLLTVRTYLGNLWSFTQISIVPNAFYTKGSSMKELFQSIKESPYFSDYASDSHLITYKGHEGFFVCSNTDWSTVMDEKSIQHPTIQCEVIIATDKKMSHFLSFIVYVDKNQKKTITQFITNAMDKMLIISNEGATDMERRATTLSYTDVIDQTPEFQESLRLLMQFGVLTPRPLFDGDSALTWEEYMRLYVWMTYHARLTDPIHPEDPKSKSFGDVLKNLAIIDPKTYVNNSQAHLFKTLLRIHLADVKLESYTEESLDRFMLQKDTTYRSEWEKINDFEYSYFHGKKIGPTGGEYFNSGYYTSKNIVSYNPHYGIRKTPILSNEKIVLGIPKLSPKDQKDFETMISCNKNTVKYFSRACVELREEAIWSFLDYTVLTRGQAISDILPEMDFGLWDTELAKKKLVTIDENK